tara:strand:+ start:424 stop:657 length:234 start_codon:yes stop_codon:yes gene_type:complete
MDKTDYDKALLIWDNLTDIIKENPYLETNKSPMHPFQYFTLSRVHNFNVLNGKNYEEYIQIWKKRYNIKIEKKKNYS